MSQYENYKDLQNKVSGIGWLAPPIPALFGQYIYLVSGYRFDNEDTAKDQENAFLKHFDIDNLGYIAGLTIYCASSYCVIFLPPRVGYQHPIEVIETIVHELSHAIQEMAVQAHNSPTEAGGEAIAYAQGSCAALIINTLATQAPTRCAYAMPSLRQALQTDLT